MESVSGTIVFAVVAGVLVLFGLIYAIALYNGLVEVRNNIEKAWKNVDVLLQQRHDELPALVEIVKGYSRHESDTLERLVQLRGDYDRASSSQGKTHAENLLNQQLGWLRVSWEAYPDLKAGELFQTLMARLGTLETGIADRRELFNDCVTIYNTAIERFPDLLLARALGFGRHPLLTVPSASRRNVKVEFGGTS